MINKDICVGEKHIHIFSVLFRGCLSIRLHLRYGRSESFKYPLVVIMIMKQRKVKVPYEGYKLPPSAEQGGQFVDFKRVIERKPVKKVKIKKR